MARNQEAATIVNSVLKTVVSAGMLGCLIVAPNALIVGDALLKHLNRRSRAGDPHRLMGYMAGQGLVTYRALSNGDFEITITEKGKRRLKKSEFDDLTVKPLDSWDGKWRLVLFDVPETRHKSRRAFSYKLKLLGFYQLQKSAWVIPYPCKKEVELIRQVFEVQPGDIVQAEVGRLDREGQLKRYFHLS